MTSNKTLFINLYAGPGAGKSTTSAQVFADLKRKDYNAELVQEYAKAKVWEQSFQVLQDQVYVFGKQHHRQFTLEGQCEVAVTDSPILLCCIYNAIYAKLENFDKLVLETFHRFDNLNYIIRRSKKYNPKGRVQTEDESKQIDHIVVEFLTRHNIPFKEIDYHDASRVILEDVAARIGDGSV